MGPKRGVILHKSPQTQKSDRLEPLKPTKKIPVRFGPPEENLFGSLIRRSLYAGPNPVAASRQRQDAFSSSSEQLGLSQLTNPIRVLRFRPDLGHLLLMDVVIGREDDPHLQPSQAGRCVPCATGEGVSPPGQRGSSPGIVVSTPASLSHLLRVRPPSRHVPTCCDGPPRFESAATLPSRGPLCSSEPC